MEQEKEKLVERIDGRVFQSLYGGMKDKETVGSVLDEVSDELKSLAGKVSKEDREVLERHLTHVREFEKRLQAKDGNAMRHPVPASDPRLEPVNDKIPETSRAQIELLAGAIANDNARVATLRYANSIGQFGNPYLCKDGPLELG